MCVVCMQVNDSYCFVGSFSLSLSHFSSFLPLELETIIFWPNGNIE